jgi:hypothetical protein
LFLFVVLQKCKSLNVLYLLSFTFKFHLEFIANKWCVTLWQISIKFSTPFNNPLIFLWLSRECIETCAQKTTCVCFFIFYCCAGGTFVTFIKVLKMYQIYHIWIHFLHHSHLSLYPHSWNSFNRHHFYIFIHVYTIFAPYFFEKPCVFVVVVLITTVTVDWIDCVLISSISMAFHPIHRFIDGI